MPPCLIGAPGRAGPAEGAAKKLDLFDLEGFKVVPVKKPDS